MYIKAIETSGGANNTNNWIRFYAAGSYAIAEIFYSENPENFYVANYMDYLPIGANTLVSPNAQDDKSYTPTRTNTSQFRGQKGQIHALDVRVFLLQSSTTASHANVSVEQTDCNQGVCFNVQLDGGDSLHIILERTEGQYVLPGTELTTSEPETPDPVEPNVATALMPVGFSASHSARVGNPEKLFDEQAELTEKPEHLSKTPELHLSSPKVKLSTTTDLPMKLAVETDSVYGRSIYVDENGETMPATVIVSLDGVHQLSELMFYDISSN